MPGVENWMLLKVATPFWAATVAVPTILPPEGPLRIFSVTLALAVVTVPPAAYSTSTTMGELIG